MRILVTGGAGFIGSNFVCSLLARYPEYEVVVLDKLTYAGNINNLSSVLPLKNCRFIRGDIADPIAVQQAMQGCQAVVNFAAETHVDRSILSCDAFIRTNIEGTHVLLEAARKHSVRRFIQISTDEVYGNALSPEGVSRPSLETDALRPMSPYAASKAAADCLAYSYWTTYRLPVVITRCGNNYGPHQYPEKQLPLFILNAIEDRPLPIYGTGENIRDWIHVYDHAAAIMTLLHQDDTVHGEIFNVGAGEERTVLQNAHIVLQLVEKPQSLIHFVGDRQGHVFRHAVNASKLKRVTNWQAQISFTEGIKQTVAWYLSNSKWLTDVNTRSNAFLEKALHLAEI
ncbi:MAG TPA: dTDP-glucose 4,6-dehydratase [Ktedonobacteraceae bacterium]|nr:dTDP-glucose 4,6-dehydratase [Ktedonobacteraceae bacterium]